MMEPIVPAGSFELVNGRALTLELKTFAVRNTNPSSDILPLLDIFHYSSDIVTGKCWVCKERRASWRQCEWSSCIHMYKHMYILKQHKRIWNQEKKKKNNS